MAVCRDGRVQTTKFVFGCKRAVVADEDGGGRQWELVTAAVRLASCFDMR
jgi:hypothetical protein